MIDTFAKVEDTDGRCGIFPWFETIEDGPIIWTFDDQTKKETRVKLTKWYIVLEYCKCSLQNLLDFVPSHKLSLFESLIYFKQLINGLEYLHSRSVVRFII